MADKSIKLKLSAFGLTVYWATFLLWVGIKGLSHIHYYFIYGFDLFRFCADTIVGILFPILLIIATHAYLTNKRAWLVNLPLYAIPTSLFLITSMFAIYRSYAVPRALPADTNSADIMPPTPFGDIGHSAALDANAILRAEDAIEREDYQTALNIVQPLAEQGNAVAKIHLGGLYIAGLGIPKNSTEGLRWIREAADQGNIQAEALLGSIYWGGANGIKKDADEATKWFKKAAAHGDKEAEGSLALMYMHGHGVKQDWSEAYFWQLVSGSTDSGFTDSIASHLTADQKAAVIKRAKDWKPVQPVTDER